MLKISRTVKTLLFVCGMLLVIHATRPTIRSMQTVRVMQDSGSTNNTTNGTNGPDVKCEEGWNLTNETDTSEAKCMPTGA